MAERLKATVSKTVAPVSGAVGSNPTLSASLYSIRPSHTVSINPISRLLDWLNDSNGHLKAS